MTLPTTYFLTREMQRILYALKRQYGGQISIRKLLNSQTDARTGKKTETTKLIPVARAVVLPAHSWCKVVRGISANKDYMAGGAYDATARDFIVDRKDVRELPTLTSDDWILYRGRKYQVSAVETFECDAGWVITARAIDGEVSQQTLTVAATDQLELNPEAKV